MSQQAEERSYSGTAIAIAIIALMGSGLAYRYWPNPERAVLRHVVNLAEALSFVGAESEALSATRFAAIREYFAPDVRIRIDDREIVSRDEVLRRLHAWTPPRGGIMVEFVNVRIVMADQDTSATVDLVAHVSARNVPRAQARIESRPVRATMDLREGDWMIRTADAGAPLSLTLASPGS